VPQFATEAEEAQWWYDNRHKHDKELLEAVERGEAQILTKERLMARIAEAKKKAAMPVVSFRISEENLAFARRQAARKGMPYQIYLESLVHETLAERGESPAKGKRRAG
jgi:predicted DNA binding CopG/RHH family protein